MKDYLLDFENEEYLIVSNDTFSFLKFDEPPLDEDNFSEINEIYNEYGDNFFITDDYKYLDDGQVSIVLVPYKESSFEYDLYLKLFNDWQLQLKLLDNNKALIRYFNPYKGPFGEEEVNIEINKSGNKQIRTKSGSIYPFKAFNKA